MTEHFYPIYLRVRSVRFLYDPYFKINNSIGYSLNLRSFIEMVMLNVKKYEMQIMKFIFQ